MLKIKIQKYKKKKRYPYKESEMLCSNNVSVYKRPWQKWKRRPCIKAANKVLNAICRKNAQEEKASPIVHKQPITKEQVEQLYPQLANLHGECHTQDPAQLLCTIWLYITLHFGKRVPENQRKLTKEILSLQSTLQGCQYYELRNLMRSKNHQGGLHDSNDESGRKMFAVPNSLRCLIKTGQSYLNPWIRNFFPTSKRGVF